MYSSLVLDTAHPVHRKGKRHNPPTLRVCTRRVVHNVTGQEKEGTGLCFVSSCVCVFFLSVVRKEEGRVGAAVAARGAIAGRVARFGDGALFRWLLMQQQQLLLLLLLLQLMVRQRQALLLLLLLLLVRLWCRASESLSARSRRRRRLRRAPTRRHRSLHRRLTKAATG